MNFIPRCRLVFLFPPFNHFLIFITENGSEQIFQKGNGMSEKVTTLKKIASGRTRIQAIICKDLVACTIFENSCFFAFSNFQWHIRVRVTGRMLEIYGETFLLLPGKPDQYAISGRQAVRMALIQKWCTQVICFSHVYESTSRFSLCPGCFSRTYSYLTRDLSIKGILGGFTCKLLNKQAPWNIFILTKK